MSPRAIAAAQDMARKVVDDLGGYGLFGVEFFVKDDEVIFSELSPRPHDTGMVTLVSQQPNEFELHLRAILGTLTVEEINNDRQSFAMKLTTEAAGDLEKMGIGLDALTIQEISDEEGYLDALGKRRTAEVKRDAEIAILFFDDAFQIGQVFLDQRTRVVVRKIAVDIIEQQDVFAGQARREVFQDFADDAVARVPCDLHRWPVRCDLKVALPRVSLRFHS